MPKKSIVSDPIQSKAPTTLKDHMFYGLTLDEEQEAFRDAIWNEDIDVVFVNARAGTGKTTIATATANLLCQYGRYKNIAYIMAPCQEGTQGFLPGDLQEKSQFYMDGFYQALTTIGVNMGIALNGDILNQKRGTGYIDTYTHTFLRGVNFENSVILIDESQNFTLNELKKVITRIKDSCKVVVLGHRGQIDLPNVNKSGFAQYLEHFRGMPRVKICELTRNYRGWISSHADELDEK